MKKLLLLAPAICILFCSCNTSANPDGSVRINQLESQTSRADWQITLDVKKAILSDNSLSLGNQFVSVSTTNGVVTISGEVSTQAQMDRIVRITRNVRGVTNVNNQMTLSS